MNGSKNSMSLAYYITDGQKKKPLCKASYIKLFDAFYMQESEGACMNGLDVFDFKDYNSYTLFSSAIKDVIIASAYAQVRVERDIYKQQLDLQTQKETGRALRDIHRQGEIDHK